MSFESKIPVGRTVSATELVRHFASLARDAINEPVHILNHGKPYLSLVHTKILSGLAQSTAQSSAESRLRAKLDIILDNIQNVVLLVDDNLDIIRGNREAISFFQLSEEDMRSVSVYRIIKGLQGSIVLNSLERVRKTHVSEIFEIQMANPRRLMKFKIVPFPGGFAIFAEDVTLSFYTRREDSFAFNLQELVANSPFIAFGTLDMRGVIETVSPALAKMIGSEPERMIGLRFPGLIDTESRADLSRELELVTTHDAILAQNVNLLNKDGEIIPSYLCAKALTDYGRPTGILFIVQMGAIHSH